jgi:hypothetical protein
MRRSAAPAALAAPAVIAAAALAAGCAEPGTGAFEVDGSVIVTAAPRGAVIALWDVESAATPYFYKYGEGTRSASQFTLTWDADPPEAALNADGFGVAIFALLPEGAAVPEGKIALEDLSIQGISAEYAVVFREATAAGPAWSTALPGRFSCTHCVRSQAGTGDSYELAPCAGVTIGSPGAPLCDW